jgi:hypothetical protein
VSLPLPLQPLRGLASPVANETLMQGGEQLLDLRRLRGTSNVLASPNLVEARVEDTLGRCAISQARCLADSASIAIKLNRPRGLFVGASVAFVFFLVEASSSPIAAHRLAPFFAFLTKVIEPLLSRVER